MLAVRQFFLVLSVIGLILVVCLVIFGNHPGRALIGVPVFIGGVAGYLRGQYTDTYEKQEVTRNTERAKASGISRLRNR